MTDKPDKPVHWGNTEFGSCAGLALMLLAFLLGVGGCCMMGGGFQVKLRDPSEAKATP